MGRRTEKDESVQKGMDTSNVGVYIQPMASTAQLTAADIDFAMFVTACEMMEMARVAQAAQAPAMRSEFARALPRPARQSQRAANVARNARAFGFTA